MTEKTTLRIYGCGGTGINILKEIMTKNESETNGFSEIKPVFLDTSESNIDHSVMTDDNTYFYDSNDTQGNKLDGSGMDRSANHAVIAARPVEILHKFKPGNINVVIHSTSGGSGSVIGPVLVSELIRKEQSVIVVLVGSFGCKKEAVNSVNTLKSYQSISTKRGVPIQASYFENNINNTMDMVNQEVMTLVGLVSIFFSGNNKSLDSADLNNLLDYRKVVGSYDPQLAYLNVFAKEIKLNKDQGVIGVVSLTKEGTSHNCGIHVDYHTFGYMNQDVLPVFENVLPLHMVSISGWFHPVMTKLESEIKAFDAAKQAISTKTIAFNLEDSTDEGLIL